MKYLYDTNIFIDYLAEETAVLPIFSELFLSKNEVIISSIVRIELLSFPELSNEEEAVITDLLMHLFNWKANYFIFMDSNFHQ